MKGETIRFENGNHVIKPCAPLCSPENIYFKESTPANTQLLRRKGAPNCCWRDMLTHAIHDIEECCAGYTVSLGIFSMRANFFTLYDSLLRGRPCIPTTMDILTTMTGMVFRSLVKVARRKIP